MATYTKFVWPDNGEKGMIDVEGGKIPYRLYGKDKKGTPFIIVHGGPGGNYSKFYPLLALSSDRPVVFYNQLGCPGSTLNENYNTNESSVNFMTIEHYVNELQSLIDYFKFNEFVLFGQSWGTMLVIEYALAKKPQGLKKIILSGPFLNTTLWIIDAERLIKTLPDGEQKWQYVKQCIEKSKEDPRIFEKDEKYNAINVEYTDNFNTRNVPRKAEIPDRDELPKILNKENGQMVETDVYNYMWGPSEFTCTGTLSKADVTCRLKNITCPILYVCGEYDSGTPAAANYYNTLTPNGKVVVIKNAAHSSYFDNSEDAIRAINEFLNN